MSRVPDAGPQYPRAFAQHGVHWHRMSGTDNAEGDCPFCGAAGHFYANVKTHQWDCKKCGARGGFATFLQMVYEAARKAFPGSKAEKELAADRGLMPETLRAAGFGYWTPSRRYVIPVWRRGDDADGRLHDLRHYQLGAKVMTTAGCTAGLWGWEQLDGHGGDAWVCEGEWDALVAREMNLPGVVLAVPGANVWKADWAALLRGYRVHLMYDNDAAGEDGMYRAYRALHGLAESIDCIQWPTGRAVGWDVRDEYTKGGRAGCVKRLRALMTPFPPGAKTLDDVLTVERATPGIPRAAAAQAVNAPPTQVSTDAGRLTPEEIYAAYRKWLYLPDAVLLDVVFACAIAARMPGDPLWLFLVAPPGGTKTEPLLAMEGASFIVSTTSVTPPALISGANFAGGGDPSLLAQFQGARGKVLVIKDFTTILQMPPMQRDEVFGILRDAYDGKTERRFGNGVHRRYECHFGLMAGVTPAIEQHMEQSVGLGERFLSYRTPVPTGLREQREFLRKARNNVGHEVKMRAELAETAKAVLAYDYLRGRQPRLPESIAEQLLYAAQVVSVLRGSVVRDRYSKEVTHRPFCELGTRLVKQLTKWSLAVAMFRGRTAVGADEYRVVTRMATGSVPSGAMAFVRKLYATDEATTAEVTAGTGLPEFPTGERILENLALLGAVDVQRVPGLRVRKAWRLRAEMREAIAESRILDPESPVAGA